MFNFAEIRDLTFREQSKHFKSDLPFYMSDSRGICQRDQLIQSIVARTYHFNRSIKTLELAVLYIDEYLNCFSIESSFLELLAITAYTLASKFNEIEVTQQIKLFKAEGQALYRDSEYNEMEVQILVALRYQLNYVTPSDYLVAMKVEMNESIISLLMLTLVDFELQKHAHIELALAIYCHWSTQQDIFSQKVLAVSQLIQHKINQTQEGPDDHEEAKQQEDTKSIERSPSVTKRISKKRNSKKQNSVQY